MLSTTRAHRLRRPFMSALAGVNGAIDLASIMVGVIVVGIVAGVIAATVFAVIPWAQNNAAQANLSAVRTAEAAYAGLAAEPAAAGAGASFALASAVTSTSSGVEYASANQLVAQKLISSADASKVTINVSSDGSCYIDQSISSTGSAFYGESTTPSVTSVNAGGSTPVFSDCDATVPPAPGAKAAGGSTGNTGTGNVGNGSGTAGDPFNAQILFSTSLESGDVQPTWVNTPDTSDPKGGNAENIGGLPGAGGPEAGTRTEGFANTGIAALMYSGVAYGSSSEHAYMQVFDLSSAPVVVTGDTTLSYWIYPQTSATSGSMPAGDTNSTCESVDAVFSDGSNIRDSGAVTNMGVPAHPADQCSVLTPDHWNHVTVDLGTHSSGLSIEKLLLGYDQPNSSGPFRGYVDDISIYNY